MINYERCIGCGRCVAACPYGARSMDSGAFYTDNTPSIPDMERGPAWEYDKKWLRRDKNLPAGKARKCQFCSHRLKNGMLPVCVATCIGRATYFGDVEDTESLISKVLEKTKTVTLKEIKGSGDSAARIESAGHKLKSAEWKNLIDQAIKNGHGSVPVFGNSVTKPRVYYTV